MSYGGIRLGEHRLGSAQLAQPGSMVLIKVLYMAMAELPQASEVFYIPTAEGWRLQEAYYIL